MRVLSHKEKGKNFGGHYTGQVDYDESQIQVFALTAKERNRLIAEAKKIIKPKKR